jgi:hypothetical protein
LLHSVYLLTAAEVKTTATNALDKSAAVDVSALVFEMMQQNCQRPLR